VKNLLKIETFHKLGQQPQLKDDPRNEKVENKKSARILSTEQVRANNSAMKAASIQQKRAKRLENRRLNWAAKKKSTPSENTNTETKKSAASENTNTGTKKRKKEVKNSSVASDKRRRVNVTDSSVISADTNIGERREGSVIVASAMISELVEFGVTAVVSELVPGLIIW
jgi:hypothetical protein